MILKFTDELIQITENENRGVFGKINKYAGDIGAGAASHVLNRVIGKSQGDGVGALSGLGAYTAYKMHDLGFKNYHNTNKSASGSLVGAGLGAGISELIMRKLTK